MSRPEARDRLAGWLTATLLAIVVALPDPARAHTRSLSYASWDLTGSGATVRVRLTALDISALPLPDARPGEPDPLATYLAGHVSLFSDGVRCPAAATPRALETTAGWATYEWRVDCPPGRDLTIEAGVLLAEKPAHLHFARVHLQDGRVLEKVFAEGDSRWELPGGSATASGSASRGTGFGGYVALGVHHILSGWDHLAFVVALLLLARTLGEVATLVTAFTIAHSVTLGLAVLGLVRPGARAVEALIGFSIALVAAENAWLLAGRTHAVPLATGALLLLLAVLAASGAGDLSAVALVGLGLFSLCHFALLDRAEHPGRLRAAVAFAFGLVHGFGFAGVLAELDLPRDRLIAALLGFNLGVEAGQLAIVALAWPLLRWAARALPAGRESLVAEIGSAGICGLGLYWFLTRAFAAG